ncbi:MAG: hypothetical protein JXR70_06095 [Spirochaetales bacterium]|nr:hypothetical protein [Spirochaetales bacterium]
MEKIKDEILQIIESIPVDMSVNEIMYRLCIIGKIHLGKEEAVINGRTFTADDLRREFSSW